MRTRSAAPEFAAIGAAEWGQVRLAVNPALKFLKLRYPANGFINAARARDVPRIPRRPGSADQLAATLGTWFREWAANRIFCR